MKVLASLLLLIDMYMTCSRPHTRPLLGWRQSRPCLKCAKRGKCSAFTGRLRGQLLSPRLSFSALRVGGCRLRFVTQLRPGVDAQWCDGLCLGAQTREEDVQPWGPMGPVVTHSSTPPALPTAVTKIQNPAMQTVRSQHQAANRARKCFHRLPDVVLQQLWGTQVNFKIHPLK